MASSLAIVLYVAIRTLTLQYIECNSKTADTATDTAIRTCQSRQFARQLELDKHGNFNTTDMAIAICTAYYGPLAFGLLVVCVILQFMIFSYAAKFYESHVVIICLQGAYHITKLR